MTHLSNLLNTELATFREQTGRKELVILETGSIRNEAEQYHQNDGWSTLTFAEHVRDFGGKLISIDLETRAADAVLTRHEVREHVDLRQGHSIDVLGELLATVSGPLLDVVLLDSDNDASLIMHEFLLAKRLMHSPGLVLVDDVEPKSALVVKGHQLVPWLANAGIETRLEIRTGDGYSTGVMAFNV